MTSGRKKWFEFINEKEKPTYESYAMSDLIKWLQDEEWEYNDALLILSNISPTGAEIEWDDGYEHAQGFWVDRISIKKMKLFSEEGWLYSTPKHDTEYQISSEAKHKNNRKSAEHAGSNFQSLEKNEITEELQKIRNCEQIIKYFKNSLPRYEFDEEGQYPVGKYLKCIEHAGLVIPWLEWAKKDILSQDYPDVKLQIIKEYDSRKGEYGEAPVSGHLGQILDFKHDFQFSHWLELDSWFVEEALLLLSGINPKTADIDWNAKDQYSRTGKTFKRVEILDAELYDHSQKHYMDMGRRLLKEITKNNEEDRYTDYELAILEMRLQDFRDVESLLNRNVRLWRSGFHSEERYPINYYVDWAIQKGMQVTWLQWAQDKGLINSQGKDLSSDSSKKYPFLDKKHSYHAKELKIAVEAWTALYEDNPPQHVPNGGHKKYILKWLEENHPALGQRARDRITTVINPNPKGGASPIIENLK